MMPKYYIESYYRFIIVQTDILNILQARTYKPYTPWVIGPWL